MQASYLKAFAEQLWSQVDVLVSNHSTLARWLLPDWAQDRPAIFREITQVAGELGGVDSLSAALRVLMAYGVDAHIAVANVMSYLHHSLQSGITLGIGTPYPSDYFRHRLRSSWRASLRQNIHFHKFIRHFS